MPFDPTECAYFTFRPRPDQPERHDQQTAFYESKHPGIAFLIGGNGSGTSETALAKVARFVLNDQPPPRKDTPFWIISESYEMVCKACWKEKLCPREGHGHIPASEIEWPRIRWYRPNQNWPFEVPLKPWPGRPGKNWNLIFKSYSQGRSQMQAESVGGFLFVEQFPWGLLTEVLRGCREYSFDGGKLAEFTPIDPALSMELEDMINEDRLPKGWQVYRANTRCAMEAGHVSEQWYHEFFGMVSDDMRDVREIGAFANYAGQIYQNFGPQHIIPFEEIEFPSGVYHRRSIDWGAGPDNAFVCLWAYKNGSGEWIVYDEYYSTDQVTVHEHLTRIADQNPWPEGNIFYGATYADPSDPGNLRIASRLSEFCPGYRNFDMSAANNRVLEGIDHVKWLLQTNPATGRPRLRIGANCKWLRKQMRTYRWIAGSEAGKNPKDARPEPLKKDDHAPDALRYLCFSDATITGATPEAVRKQRRDNFRGVRLDRRATTR